MARPVAPSGGVASPGASRNRSTFRWKLRAPTWVTRSGIQGTPHPGAMLILCPPWPLQVCPVAPVPPRCPCPHALHLTPPPCPRVPIPNSCPHTPVPIPSPVLMSPCPCLVSACPHIPVPIPCPPAVSPLGVPPCSPVQESHQHAQEAVCHLHAKLRGDLGGSVHVRPQQLWARAPLGVGAWPPAPCPTRGMAATTMVSPGGAATPPSPWSTSASWCPYRVPWHPGGPMGYLGTLVSLQGTWAPWWPYRVPGHPHGLMGYPGILVALWGAQAPWWPHGVPGHPSTPMGLWVTPQSPGSPWGGGRAHTPVTRVASPSCRSWLEASSAHVSSLSCSSCATATSTFAWYRAQRAWGHQWAWGQQGTGTPASPQPWDCPYAHPSATTVPIVFPFQCHHVAHHVPIPVSIPVPPQYHPGAHPSATMVPPHRSSCAHPSTHPGVTTCPSQCHHIAQCESIPVPPRCPSWDHPSTHPGAHPSVTVVPPQCPSLSHPSPRPLPVSVPTAVPVP